MEWLVSSSISFRGSLALASWRVPAKNAKAFRPIFLLNVFMKLGLEICDDNE